MTHENFSPLRYPGGKGKLSQYVARTILDNNLKGCEYVEPFVGGGAVALYLLQKGFVRHIHINDIDPAIYSFWKHAVYNTQELISLIETTPVTIDEWKKQRDIQRNKENFVGTLDLAFSTLFLNRTNRSGILWAGPIGGQKQDGAWKLDCRFNKERIRKQLNSLAAFRENISIYRLDARELIEEVGERKGQFFFYIDPPYYLKGQSLYLNSFTHLDHLKLSQIIKTLPANWLVSYDNVSEITDLYDGCGKVEYGIQYSVQRKYRGKEVIFYPRCQTVPDTQEPSKYRL